MQSPKKNYEDITVKELQKALQEAEVKFDYSANKEELYELYSAQYESEPAEEEQTPEPITEESLSVKPEQKTSEEKEKIEEEEMKPDPKATETIDRNNPAQVRKAGRLQAELQIQRLEKAPKIRTMIPEEGNENNADATLEVGLNGVLFSFVRGQYYDLPVPIANIIEQSRASTRKALDRPELDINRSRNVRDALV